MTVLVGGSGVGGAAAAAIILGVVTSLAAVGYLVVTRNKTVFRAVTVVAVLVIGITATWVGVVNADFTDSSGAGPDSKVTTVATTPTTTATSAAPTAAPTSPTSVSSTSASNIATETTTREVRLDRPSGIDLESSGTKGRKTDGATGGIDLYLDDFNVLHANGGDFHKDGGPEAGARARCAEAIAAQHNAEPQLLPASPGMQYCFTTSEGRTAWLRVKHSALLSFDAGYVVLAAAVW
ncbi:hypothetical protein [Saccharothrix deserti]|uniref:hypothetical protein n=1 Tax=Saccharothrix deserti TaxID=2593674 RepID=UPI00131C9147|nr:hypothetical protein [Saccharothrix deserti]